MFRKKNIIKKNQRVFFFWGGGSVVLVLVLKLKRLGLDIVQTVDMTSSDHLC